MFLAAIFWLNLSCITSGLSSLQAKALSAEQRAEVMAQIKAATSLEEIERLEKLLEVGAA